MGVFVSWLVGSLVWLSLFFSGWLVVCVLVFVSLSVCLCVLCEYLCVDVLDCVAFPLCLCLRACLCLSLFVCVCVRLCVRVFI